MSDMTTSELLELKKEIDKSKETLSELKGKKKMLIEHLKKEFDCEYKDIEKVKDQLTKKIDNLTADKDKIITKLKEEYDF